jgi:hypothetical protein
MKKIIVICLALVLVFSASFTAFAAPGGFYVSPSTKKAPELVSGTNEIEACQSKIIVTAYGDRDQLTEQARKDIESAYASIVGTENLNKLVAALNSVAETRGMDVSKFAASDLFDISATECTTGHDSHGKFEITLKHDTLKDFVAVIHYKNGTWTLVEDALVKNDGEHLEFTVDSFSPFAIIVNTGDVVTPVTDDEGSILPYVGAGIGLAALAALVIIPIVLRKRKEEAEQ